MRPVIWAVFAALISAPIGTSVGATAATADAAAPVAVSVELDRSAVSTGIGQKFSFVSTVHNDSDQPMPDLIAHLNVLSIDPAVYVDPEDWSARRTIYLAAIPARGSARLTWDVQAVNAGRFAVYVAVTTKRGAEQVTGSTVLRLAVAQERTLNPEGVLPLAAAVPTVLLVLVALAARRHRRLR
jgi:hypothetical protein